MISTSLKGGNKHNIYDISIYIYMISKYMYIYMISIYLSVYLSVCLSIYLSVELHRCSNDDNVVFCGPDTGCVNWLELPPFGVAIQLA